MALSGDNYVNGDLMGFVLVVFVGVFAAGLDSIVEDTRFVQKRPGLQYLLGRPATRSRLPCCDAPT